MQRLNPCATPSSTTTTSPTAISTASHTSHTSFTEAKPATRTSLKPNPSVYNFIKSISRNGTKALNAFNQLCPTDQVTCGQYLQYYTTKFVLRKASIGLDGL